LLAELPGWRIGPAGCLVNSLDAWPQIMAQAHASKVQASTQVHKQRCRQKASAGKQQAAMQAAGLFMVQFDVRMLASWNINSTQYCT